jgi:hypothetical protein
MSKPDDKTTLPAAEPLHPPAAEEMPPWEDLIYLAPEPPPGWVPDPTSFDDTPPPQLIRTVNLLPIPDHGLSGPDDVQKIADFILERAREGIGDIFEHEDYGGLDCPTEPWARVIAEHQTGIPYTQPVYFYDGSQKRVASAIVESGRYPLVGQCQQSVTTALCLGGWDGGVYGDIGSGIDAQPFCARAGKGWTEVPPILRDWPEELWEEVAVGSCLFWSAPCPMTKDGKTCRGNAHVPGCGNGSGHVVMILRKHPTLRKWQLWDTQTSFVDNAVHLAAAKGARMLWESHWWEWIPMPMPNGWVFRGIGRLDGLGELRPDPKPRGRCRLLLRRRSDRSLLYRSAWLSMEEEGLPIAWLLRSLRGAPFFKEIEAMWCINSAREAPTQNAPDNRPLLDCIVDAEGNAKIFWNPKSGLHDRANIKDWSGAQPFIVRSAE